jgi:glutamate--cysteine ligase
MSNASEPQSLPSQAPLGSLGTHGPKKTMPDSPLLRSYDELYGPFLLGIKEPSAFRVGTEAEKSGVRADGSAVPYSGKTGISAVLSALAERGWVAEREHEDGPIIALLKNGASVTLEPGAQLELSGAPLRTIHETAAEMKAHLDEVGSIGQALDIHFLGLGFHPFARREDLEWVPKLRYGVMQKYLPTRGGHGLDMMLRTSTVQANYDFRSEADAMRKLQIALRISPIVSAMFANSPFVDGFATGERSHRVKVWLDVDPDRSGLLPFAWTDKELHFRDYIEWALDVPMFLVKRGKDIVHNTGQTFRAFWKEGFAGEKPTLLDWTTHINTVFPEVRLKRTLEIRGADAQAEDMLSALPALYKGILHDERALALTESLASKLSYAEVEKARPEIGDKALRARLTSSTGTSREVAAWAAELLEIAEGGLERLGDRNAQGQDERIYLSTLRELVAAGESPADRVLRLLGGKTDKASIIAVTRLR